MARLEVLYIEGCAHYEPLVSRLPGLLERAGVESEVELRIVDSETEARRLRFLGSPTVRVDGRDVELGAEERGDYGLSCRLYRTGDGMTGAPPDGLILAALRAPDIFTGRPLERRLDGCPPAYRELHRNTLRAFLAGRVPEFATAHEEAIRELERRDVLWLDRGSRRVAVAYPFSGTETAHAVQVSATRVFAMCALDALGIPFLAGEPATVHSSDPATGQRITVHIDPAGSWDSNPEGAVVTASVSGSGPSASCCCPHVNFASNGDRAAGRVLEMADAIKLGRKLFGSALTGSATE
jgi:hypothetical protein